jgi:hypothetical protein
MGRGVRRHGRSSRRALRELLPRAAPPRAPPASTSTQTVPLSRLRGESARPPTGGVGPLFSPPARGPLSQPRRWAALSPPARAHAVATSAWGPLSRLRAGPLSQPPCPGRSPPASRAQRSVAQPGSRARTSARRRGRAPAITPNRLRARAPDGRRGVGRARMRSERLAPAPPGVDQVVSRRLGGSGSVPSAGTHDPLDRARRDRRAGALRRSPRRVLPTPSLDSGGRAGAEPPAGRDGGRRASSAVLQAGGAHRASRSRRAAFALRDGWTCARRSPCRAPASARGPRATSSAVPLAPRLLTRRHAARASSARAPSRSACRLIAGRGATASLACRALGVALRDGGCRASWATRSSAVAQAGFRAPRAAPRRAR